MKSMKKMLCLLLVAMLLVAAIPVAASADEGADPQAQNVPDTNLTTANYELIVDGRSSTGTVNVTNGGMTGYEILVSLDPNYVIDYVFSKCYINGVDEGGAKKVMPGDTVRLEVNTPAPPAPAACEVFLKYGSETRKITTTVGADLTLTDALVRSKNFNLPENSTVKHFVRIDTQDVILPGSTIKALANLELEVVTQVNSSNNNNGGTGITGGGSGTGGSNSGNNDSNNNNNNNTTTSLTFPDYATFKIGSKVVYGKWVNNQSELNAARAEAVNIMRNMGYKVNSWSVKQK